MSNLFNLDCQDFIRSLNKNHVKYILVGGYAVILHGYVRSTADINLDVAYENSLVLNQDKLQIRYLHLNDLLEAKKAVGRLRVK